MKKILDLAYDSTDVMQKLDVYLPDGEVNTVFVYFHGGGIEEGDKSEFAPVGEYLTKFNIAFISANYRLYPKYQYPDFLYDAAKAVAYAHGYARDTLGCDRLYVGGSSAGGYMTMMLCFDRKYLDSVGIDNSVISGYLHDSGQPTAHFNVLKYKGIDPRRVIIDETAPLYYLGIEEKYPPMRFTVSDNDIINRYEQTMLTLTTLSHFGYTGYDHVVLHGAHYEHCRKIGDDGESVFGKIIYDFIAKLEKNANNI